MHVKVGSDCLAYNLVGNVTSVISYSELEESACLANVSLFAFVLLALDHVYTIKCIAVNFSFYLPNI